MKLVEWKIDETIDRWCVEHHETVNFLDGLAWFGVNRVFWRDITGAVIETTPEAYGTD